MAQLIPKCDVRYCRNLSSLVYLGHPICDRCWTRWADNTVELRRRLGLRDTKPGGKADAGQPEI